MPHKIQEDKINFNRFFLSNTKESLNTYEEVVNITRDTIIQSIIKQNSPFQGRSFEQITKIIDEIPIEMKSEQNIKNVLKNIEENIIGNSLFVSNPLSIAHLHCPPIIPALAAEMIISSLNQSMDSWDQSPSATILEQKIVNWLCNIFGYELDADGVFTSGGTLSNYMGILLARNYYCNKYLKWDIQRKGLPSNYNKLRILCSEHAHFTVAKSAMQLGLGTDAVVTIKTDSRQKLCIKDLSLQIERLLKEGLEPFVIVATAGTTDYGSIDPLEKIASYIKDKKIWLHIDAAYGGALIMSEKYKGKLDGIQFADSITVDFHKLFYQPISCGAFLIKDKNNFNLIKMHAEYLNPEEDEEDGIINLVGKSIQTTRRFDALKLFLSIQTLGTKVFGQIVDYTVQLALQAKEIISSYPNMEVYNKPEINAIVFRYIMENRDENKNHKHGENKINLEIQKQLLITGRANIAKTKIKDVAYLKLTILNPQTTIEDIKKLVTNIISLGDEIKQAL